MPSSHEQVLRIASEAFQAHWSSRPPAGFVPARCMRHTVILLLLHLREAPSPPSTVRLVGEALAGCQPILLSDEPMQLNTNGMDRDGTNKLGRLEIIIFHWETALVKTQLRSEQSRPSSCCQTILIMTLSSTEK